MADELRATPRPASAAVDDEVLTVAAARAALPATLRRFRSDPHALPVFVGSHRKVDAAIVPIRFYRDMWDNAPPGEQTSVLEFLKGRRNLVSRLAAMNRIDAVAVFGSVVREQEQANSDVDLLVDPADDASLFDLAQFAEDMELLLGRPVDVVSRRGLDGERDRAILAEAVVL